LNNLDLLNGLAYSLSQIPDEYGGRLYDIAIDLASLDVPPEVLQIFYERAIAANQPEAYLNYGNIFFQRGDLDGALKAYRAGLDHGDIKCAVALGDVLARRKDLAGAINAYRLIDWPSVREFVAKEEPELVSVVEKLASGEWIDVPPEIAQRFPDDVGILPLNGILKIVPMARYRIAMLYGEMGKRKKKKKLLLRDSEISDDAACELVSEGWLTLEESISLLERHLERGNTDVAIPLANLYEEQGDIEKAETTLREDVKRGDFNAIFNLGMLLVENGSEHEGIKYIIEAADKGDSNALSWLNRPIPSSPSERA
jgi:tetratricopeptide (TPR) repeat protein